MPLIEKPEAKPLRPEFSSGPCAKRPGWDIKKVVCTAYLGRSHRANGPQSQIRDVLGLTKEILEIPENYKVGLVPGSNTGAFEMAMWTLLGKLPVDLFAWENFGLEWVNDVVKQLKLQDFRVTSASYGSLPDFTTLRNKSDACFTWNGTTSGARVPNADWIPDDREGLVLCDATSAVFGQTIDWKKLDATTFSWQKAMGGEAAHGILVLSPKAIKRLKTYTPDRPLPKVFRLANNGKIKEEIFLGETINTPSMFCIADALDSLRWIQEIGGVKNTVERAITNFQILQNWIDKQDWIENLVDVKAHRSNTSVCVKIIAKEFQNLTQDQQRQFVKNFVSLLEEHRVAYDINGHRAAPPGLRIWCGATVESADIVALLPWLEWAFHKTTQEFP